MFRGKGWFSGGGLWKPKNPHSLEHLKYLYHLLSKNQSVTEQNKGLLVETLRSIAEILIWGDQNDSTVFDFFLEKNMLSFFLKIMKQKCGRYVCVQLLQTLNILFENIRNETSLYYLLSNNHVNSIIVHKFDFSDEEVMAYYISFLKTLSLKLNSHTIHFFYNEHTNDFPLYTEAIKFFNHSEKMVRIAVRTLTLNVFKVDDRAMLKFVRDKTAAPYFSNLVWFIGNHVLDLDSCVRNDADSQCRNRLGDLVAEHLDHLHYLNDILRLDIETLNEVLTDHLLRRLLIPLYVYSLTKRRRHSQMEDDKPHVSSVVSLFLLSQVFLIIDHQPLVRHLAHIILNRDMRVFSSRYSQDIRIRKVDLSNGPEFVAPETTLENSLAINGNVQDPPLSSSVSVDDSLTMATTKDDHSLSREAGIRENRSSSVSEPISRVPYEEAASVPSSRRDAMLTFAANGLNITDEEKVEAAQRLNLSSIEQLQEEFSLNERPFLEAIFNALECTENDHAALFALCLLYALGHNSGINQDLLDTVLMPTDKSETKHLYNVHLVEKLIKIIHLSCQNNSRVRLATLEMSVLLLKQLVLKDGSSFLQDRHLAAIEQAREESTLLLRNFYKVWSEEIFLDMFEDEYQEMKKRPLNVEYLMMDANLLLPPTGTPMSGVEFHKRLPCGEVEGARRAIRVFFILRELSLTLRGEPETQLPLTNASQCIRVHDVLDLNNSDLIACTVVTKDGQKMRRFMVIEVLQIILVEPDTKRLGWGVAKFVGFLQDIEVGGDKDDSRCLYITIHRHGSAASGNNRTPLLAARFVFDDHIRCLAAKQRLMKGRLKARQRKMHQIARLLDLPDNVQPCPSPLRHSLRAVREGGDLQSGIQRSQSQDTNLRIRSSSGGGAHGLHRPMFSATNKVPGFATAVRNEQTNSGSASSSDSPTARSTGSPSGTRRRVVSSSSTRSRDSSPRQQAGSESEEIPLEDLSQSRGSRHNSPMMRRHASSGLPQARISAPPALVHASSQSSPPGSPKNFQGSERRAAEEFMDFPPAAGHCNRSSGRTLYDDQSSSSDAAIASVHTHMGPSPKTLRPADTPKVSLLATAEEEEDAAAAAIGRLRPVPPSQAGAPFGEPPSGSSSDLESPPPVCTKACCMLETSFMEKQLPGHGAGDGEDEDQQSASTASNSGTAGDAAIGGTEDNQSIVSDMFAVPDEDSTDRDLQTRVETPLSTNGLGDDKLPPTDDEASNVRTPVKSTKKSAHKQKGAIQTV